MNPTGYNMHIYVHVVGDTLVNLDLGRSWLQAVNTCLPV